MKDLNQIGNEEMSEYTSPHGEGRYQRWCVCEEGLRYGDLSYAVNGALMKVHRELGPGREVNAWRTGDHTLVHLSGCPEGPAKQNRAVV